MGRIRYGAQACQTSVGGWLPGDGGPCVDTADGGRKAKLQPLYLAKAKRQLEAMSEQVQLQHGPQKVAFLVLAGALDPAHQGHLAALEAARDHVKSLARIPVVAGFLAPSAALARAVAGEAGAAPLAAAPDALSLAMRSRLCAAACADSDWIDVCPWGWPRSQRMVDRMRRQLEDRLGSTAGIDWAIEGWWVVGSRGHLATHLEEQLTPVVCMAKDVAEAVPYQAARPGLCSPPSSAPRNFRVQRYFASPLAVVVRRRSCGSACVDATELQLLLQDGSFEEIESRQWVPEPELRILKDCLRPDARASDLQAGEGQTLDDGTTAMATVRSNAVALPAELEPDTPSLAEPPANAPFVLHEARAGSPSWAGGQGAVHCSSGSAAKAGQCGGRKIIAHFCNDQGNGGRGFFQDIKKEWGPGPSRAYFEWHRDRPASMFRLGAAQIVPVGKMAEVANMIAQQGSKSGSRGPSGREDAASEAFGAVCGYAASREASVHVPWVGPSRAGLRWDQIMSLAKKASKRHGVAVYLYT